MKNLIKLFNFFPTKKVLALTVVGSVVVFIGTGTQIPEGYMGFAGLVIGFYFGRSNKESEGFDNDQ
jgi:Na+/H+ antiporter NhaC